MFFSTERKRLEAAIEKQFSDRCRDEFTEQSVTATNQRQVKALTGWSYLPNLISITTAGFFILYLLQSYSLTVKIVLGILLLTVAAAMEIGKRNLISETGKRYFALGKVSLLAGAAVVVLIGISSTASYIGGNQLVVSTATPPPRAANPEIDSLRQLLAAESKLSDRLRNTTWRGKVTRDAQAGIIQSKTLQSKIFSRIDQLDSIDRAAHSELMGTHKAKVSKFGVVLGLIAVLADLTLFLLLWTIKRLKYEVAILAVSGAHTVTEKPHFEQLTPTSDPAILNQHRRSIGFRVGNNGDRNNGDRMKAEKVVIDGRKIRKCDHCGELFTYKHWNAKYCSDNCRVKAWEERTGRKLKKHKSQ